LVGALLRRRGDQLVEMIVARPRELYAELLFGHDADVPLAEWPSPSDRGGYRIVISGIPELQLDLGFGGEDPSWTSRSATGPRGEVDPRRGRGPTRRRFRRLRNSRTARVQHRKTRAHARAA
jgi:hypothetical protein